VDAIGLVLANVIELWCGDDLAGLVIARAPRQAKGPAV
jgi:hypothetical protein